MLSKKIVAIIAVAAVAVVLILGLEFRKPATVTGTADEAAVISTQTDAALAEQLAAIPDTSSGFAASAQNDIANDSSQFLYQ